MFTVTATFDVTILYFVAVNVIAVLSYILIIRHRQRALQRNLTVLTNAITDYFRVSGAEVAVECDGNLSHSSVRSPRNVFAIQTSSKFS